MRKIPEREAAKAAEERFYTTGKPCRNGHISKRYTSTGICAKCAIRNTIKCQSAAPQHPARIAARAAGDKHYSIDRPCQNGHESKRYVSNGVCVTCDAAKGKRWKGLRPGVEAKWARERRAKDPTGHRAEVKRWQKKNPEKVKAISVVAHGNRRGRELMADGKFTHEDVTKIRIRQKNRCAECKEKKRLEIDHIKPLSRGGSNSPTNLQMLCRSCNAQKNARDPIEWAQIKGRLV